MVQQKVMVVVLAPHSSLNSFSSSHQLGGSDYQLITPQLIFEEGVSKQTVEVRILGDDVVEETEAFRVGIFVIEQPVTVKFTIEEAVVIIEDDDG